VKSVSLLVIDDSSVIAKLFEKLVKITFINTKDENIIEVLDEIKKQTRNNNINAIFINAHLKCKDYPYRHQCGGIELLKHIRLTKELGNACLLPIILGTLLPTKYYIRKSPDNVIILSRGCKCLFLPKLSNDRLNSAIEKLKGEKFDDFEIMKSKIKRYVIFTSEEEAITKHDYQNIVGIKKFVKEFCEQHDENHPFLQEYQQVFQKSLWLKKFEFLGKFPVEESISTSCSIVEKLLKDKKFILVDDEHERGWSYILYSELIKNTTISPDYFKNEDDQIETPDKCFLCFREYENADKFFTNIQNNIIPYDLIFLDLRLQTEDKHRNIEELSGIKLLKNIKEFDASVPVIVFTASEKAGLIATDLGADAYWIKAVSSGNELKKQIEECLEVYASSRFIHGLENENINLRKIWDKIKQVESKEEIYSVEISKKNGFKLTTLESERKREIVILLKKAFLFLRSKVTKYEESFTQYSSHNLIAVIMGIIQEKRFKIEDKKDKEILKEIIWKREKLEKQITLTRNEAAHRGQITPHNAIQVFKWTLDFLLADKNYYERVYCRRNRIYH